jgi:hypothetical protein
MAAPSQRPIAGKLGIKSGNRVAILHAPKGYTSALGKIPADASLATRLAGEPFDLVQAFYEDQRSLKADLPKLKKAIHSSGKIWVCWRKGNVTDLSRDSIWAIGNEVGLESVASVAIDDDWSALKLMFAKSKRKSSTSDHKSK